ncbi:hypothetical protein QTP88_008756 [Uroleucon formosanum]
MACRSSNPSRRCTQHRKPGRRTTSLGGPSRRLRTAHCTHHIRSSDALSQPPPPSSGLTPIVTRPLHSSHPLPTPRAQQQHQHDQYTSAAAPRFAATASATTTLLASPKRAAALRPRSEVRSLYIPRRVLTPPARRFVSAHSPPPTAARRGPSARQRSRQQCNASVIYPVDPGFCRIIDTFRSSSLQVSYGWKFTPTRGGTKLDGRKPRRLSSIVYNILLLVD